jgi:hypothetical protein
MQAKHDPLLYGLLAEFDGPAELIRATERAHEAGYRRLDAYSPYPIEELAEALGFHNTHMPLVVLIGGIIGCISGFAMQYYACVYGYPYSVGGRPFNSWPMFIPITFELTVLCAAIAAVFGMLALNGLPMPYHPLFGVPQFSKATKDGFFLCIQARDAKFDLQGTREFLASLEPREVTEVSE